MNIEREVGTTVKTAFSIVTLPLRNTLGVVVDAYKRKREKALSEKMLVSKLGQKFSTGK